LLGAFRAHLEVPPFSGPPCSTTTRRSLRELSVRTARLRIVHPVICQHRCSHLRNATLNRWPIIRAAELVKTDRERPIPAGFYPGVAPVIVAVQRHRQYAKRSSQRHPRPGRRQENRDVSRHDLAVEFVMACPLFSLLRESSCLQARTTAGRSSELPMSTGAPPGPDRQWLFSTCERAGG